MNKLVASADLWVILFTSEDMEYHFKVVLNQIMVALRQIRVALKILGVVLRQIKVVLKKILRLRSD